MSTVTQPKHVASPATQPAEAPAKKQFGTGVWNSFLGVLPTATVLAIFTGVAYWGHMNDWTVPKFSALVGEGPSIRKDWCEEHNVPESKCVECNPTLLPKGADYGWCAEHGVSNCPLHHTDVAQVKNVPTVTQADFARASRALAIRERASNNSLCKVYLTRIQFASLDAVKEAGVDVEPVERKPITESVTGNGEIVYDQTRLGNIASRAPGSVWRVLKNVGDRVQEGEVLAIVDAQLIGQAKGELIDALVQESLQHKTVKRLSGLPDGVVAGRKVLEAEADFEKAGVSVLRAQQTLANLGLSVDVEKLKALPHQDQVEELRRLGFENVEQLDSSGIASANLLPIRSPMNGIVVERNVVAGEVVDSARPLFRVADTSKMWLTLNVPLEEASRLALGQEARFRPDGSKQEVSGKLSWISTATNRETRMLEVRAELPNPDGLLRDETFGAGQIVLRDEPEAIVVPNSAVHWEGCCHVVFVRNKHYFDSPESFKVFHVRPVRLGAKNEKYTEIIAGVLPGEVVTTTGSDVLRAQLLKNSLGEGCTCGQ